MKKHKLGTISCEACGKHIELNDLNNIKLWCSSKCEKEHKRKEKQAESKAEKIRDCSLCAQKITGKGIIMLEDPGLKPFKFCSEKCFENWEPE